VTALQIAETLSRATTRPERTALADKLAEQMGVSRGTILRRARQAGARANDAVRSDAGASAVSDEHVEILAGVVAKSQRLNGQVVAPVKGAAEMLAANGRIPKLSASTWCRALRSAELSKKEMTASPTWRNRSTTPGQVFLLDSSTSLQWYFPDGAGEGDMREIPAGTQIRLYKPEVAASLKKQIKRYFIVDHASGYLAGRYVYAPGETELDTVDVFLEACRLMGVPRFCYVDRGPGNTSFGMKYLLWLLGVEIIWKGHEAWTLGRIDGVHGIVQKGLEWRFPFARPTSIAQMNELLAAWRHVHNCEAVHREAGKTRQEMMLAAEEGVLRRLPDGVDLRAAQLARPVTRRIDGRGNFQYGGRLWRIESAEIFGTTQFVSINPFAPHTLLVLKDFSLETMQCSARIEATEDKIGAFGLPMSAAPLIGAHPVGARQPALKVRIAAAKRRAVEVVAEEKLDVYADLRGSTPAAFAEQKMAKRLAAAEQIDVGKAAPTYSPAAAVYRVGQALRAAGLEFTDAQAAELQAWQNRPEIPAADVEAVIHRFTGRDGSMLEEEATA